MNLIIERKHNFNLIPRNFEGGVVFDVTPLYIHINRFFDEFENSVIDDA